MIETFRYEKNNHQPIRVLGNINDQVEYMDESAIDSHTRIYHFGDNMSIIDAMGESREYFGSTFVV
jgi:hypothetical protein